MPDCSIQYIELAHDSPLFGEAYEVFESDIGPGFLETREFLKRRLRVRDEGLKSGREKILIQDGYTLHLIAAKVGSKVAGAIYGHCISKIGIDNRSVGFITYIAVLREYRRQGIASKLIEEIRARIDEDAIRMTGQPAIGIVFEIEEEGKEGIKGVLRKRHAAPLDIIYYQPAIRHETTPERMDFWFLPLDPGRDGEMRIRKYPTGFIVSMVTNLLKMEYVGPDLKGFDTRSKPFTEFLESIAGRGEIGLRR